MGVMWTQSHDRLPEPVVHLLVANMYAIGFILVVMGRSELFTEQTTLAVLPVLNRSASITSLLRLWVVVYIANLLGAAHFSPGSSPLPGLHWEASHLTHLETSRHRVVDHGSLAIFLSALLAGWLMGLLSWLVAASRDTIGQIVIVWLITTSIGFASLHHVIAGAIEIFAGIFAHQGISPANAARVLAVTTLGNMLGGTVFVAVIKFGHVKPTADGEALD